MGPITPICRLAVAAALACASSLVSAKTENAVDQFATARLAEIDNRNGDALKGYIKLYQKAPDSGVLADRIFNTAIRSGDMAAALRMVRTQELRGEVSGEAPLLLFADAFARKNWPMAKLAADELSVRGNFGFMNPILQSWVNVAQGKAADLPEADANADPLFAFYSNDQRIYLQLATGEFANAKLGLRSMAAIGDNYARDLMLRSAPVISAQGDHMFGDALVRSAVDADGQAWPLAKKRKAKLSAKEGLSALHVRIAGALLEQNLKDQALVLARIALWYSPDDEPAKLMLANALAAQSLNQQASALAQTIMPTSLYWPQAVKQRVANFAPAEATILAQKAARDWPKSVDLALLAAQTEESVGDLPSATARYRSIVDNAATGGVSPQQRAHYHLLLASALDKAGNWKDARVQLDLALVLDPNNAQILNYLGYSFLERNQDVARASAMVRKAFEFAPGSTAIMDSVGWAHFQTGEFAQAVTLLEKAAKASGNDLAINEHLGDAYWRRGRMRDARYAWRVASQTAEGEVATRLAGKIDIGLPQL